MGANSEDWIYSIKLVSGSGNYVSTGYCKTPTGGQHLNAMLVNSAGTKIWEQTYSCIDDGIGFAIYEHPMGYVIIGRGRSASGCIAPTSMFSICVEKTTGNIIAT